MQHENIERPAILSPAPNCEADRRLDYQLSLGQMLYRSLIAVNGGGLAALFLIFSRADGALDSDPRKLWLAFAFFAFGLFATIFSGIFAFLSQRCYYDVALTPEGTAHDARAARSGKMGDTLLVMGASCVIIATLAFLTGAACAFLGATGGGA